MRDLNCPKVFKDAFVFLIEKYKFQIIKESTSGLGFFYVYQNPFAKVGIAYDYRDNFFDIDIVRGGNTPYPNDQDAENIKDIYCLVEKYSIPNISKDDLQPNGEDYKTPLKKIITILNDYGGDILIGKESF